MSDRSRSPEYIRVKVVEEEFNNEMYFSLAMSTEMRKLKKSYAKREDISVSLLRFVFKGRYIIDKDTPTDLGMVQDDIIEVYQAGHDAENRDFEFSETKVAGYKTPTSPSTTTVTNMSASSSLEEGEIAVLPKSNIDNIISPTTTKTKERDSPSSPVKMDFDEKKQNVAVDGEKSKEKKSRYSHNSGKFFLLNSKTTIFYTEV